MRAFLGLAALVALPLSAAQAQSFGTTTTLGISSGRWVSTSMQGHHRRDGNRRVNVHRGLPGLYGYAGYGDYSDFDGNRSFDPDKWNDWWHDRPDRAYPHWMTQNADCARRWYSGDVLTC